MSYNDLREAVHDLSGFAMQAVRRVEREIFGSWIKLSGERGLRSALKTHGVDEDIVDNTVNAPKGGSRIKSGLFHELYAELQMLADLTLFHRTHGHKFKPEKNEEQLIFAPTKSPDRIAVVIPNRVMLRLQALENQPEKTLAV